MPSAFAIHGDMNTVAFEVHGKGFADELAALLGVDSGGCSPAFNGLGSPCVKLHKYVRYDQCWQRWLGYLQ